MADLPSRLDLYALGRSFVLERSEKIDPVQVDIAGSDINIFVGVVSMMAHSVVLQLAYSINRLLLDGARGEDLDRYGVDRYKLPRKGASAAVGKVRFYRTVVGSEGSIPVGTKIVTKSGIEYVTTTVASFGADDKESTADVRAVQAGKATQVGKNTLVKFANVGAVFDQTIKVNNDDHTAGGEDREDDETYRERIRDFWLTARRGTLPAIEFGARAVLGVVSAQAVEAISTGNTPARLVNLYIADSTGVSNLVLANLVRIALDEYRAAGITVLVFTSVVQMVDIEFSFTFAANVDTLTVGGAAIAATVEYVNSLPVNGILLRSAIGSVLFRFKNDGLMVKDDTIKIPIGDLVPDPGKTLRTTFARVKAV